ncbi:MAG: serine/threonine-protein kinase [Thermotogota bacterium]|nr:serine/threonine-protein kinase [Thermotogota bacterium]
MLVSLGRGGFGLTYLCEDLKTGEYVAVKEFFPEGAVRRSSSVELPSSSEWDNTFEKIEHFLEEAELISLIDDPRIVKVISAFKENKTAYYVMEFIQGRTLRKYVNERGFLSDLEFKELIDEIGKGLQTIHSKGILHGDLKPSNILITDKEKAVKITDFGAASSIGSLYRGSIGNIVSRHYSAPERFTQEMILTVQSDIYSMGAIIYFMVTGQDPLPATNRLKGEKMKFPPISKKLKKAIERSMKLLPQNRFPDVRSLLKYLDSPIRYLFS